MKVLVIGMMRTGTLSTPSVPEWNSRSKLIPGDLGMQTALEQLGYGPCYHMVSNFQNPMECEMWTEAFNAKFHDKGRKYSKKDWDQLLGHCQAVADVPTAAFIPELHEAYPDAKVIIVQRDPEKWFASCRQTVMYFAGSKSFPGSLEMPILYYLDPWLCRRMAPMMGVLFTSLFGSETKDPVKVKENWIQGYNKLYDEVRSVVPEGQRLEFSLDQGWEPLCKFLGKDEVPKTPFPHVHDSENFQAGIRVMVNRMWIRAFKMNAPYVAVGLSIAAAWWWQRSR